MFSVNNEDIFYSCGQQAPRHYFPCGRLPALFFQLDQTDRGTAGVPRSNRAFLTAAVHLILMQDLISTAVVMDSVNSQQEQAESSGHAVSS